LGAFVVAATVSIGYSTSRKLEVAVKGKAEHGKAPDPIPVTNRVEDIEVMSPVRVLDLEAADAKIREEARSFVFDSSDGATGRVDVVRLSSNCPVEDDWSVAVGKGVGGQEKTLFTGVYDGHAGWATSTVLREALIPYVSTSLAGLSKPSDAGAVDAAIKRAFTQLDDRIMTTAQDAISSHPLASAEGIAALAPAIAGSCALLSIYDPASSILRTAVTGDSRAVLGRWSQDTKSHSAGILSVDQTGFNQKEVDRLSQAHPGEIQDIVNPNSGRLLGMAVTRAFGDHRWKWPMDQIQKAKSNFFGMDPRPKYRTPPYMTAEPEVITKEVRAEDFVILGSDGLWDYISNEDAVTCVSQWLSAQRGSGGPGAAAVRKEATNGNGNPGLVVEKEDWLSWTVTPEDFVFEDLDSAAVCLVKNAFGGRKRGLFTGVVTAREPASRYVRDDITVMVVFFRDPKETK
jgi:pyruvate dehydrogenase phosphatase